VAIIFNGAHEAYRSTLDRLEEIQAAPLFVELGWYPQVGHYQIDAQGVNASASWRHEPLQADLTATLPVREQGDLLAVLQLDLDTQITRHSPWFGQMHSFVQFLAQHSALPVRVRPHPLHENKSSLRELADAFGLAWDESPSLAAALASARAVACINSSAALEAMSCGLPVLCYGEAIYRHSGAVYRLSADGAETKRVTSELNAGHCELSTAAIEAMLTRVRSRQWQPQEVPTRFPSFLAAMLRGHVRSTRKQTILSMKRTLTWLNDLPARMLYRQRRAS
jgi:hypothetical protein